MAGQFDGKVAVITGAGRGMGRTIAEALAREGAAVVVGARTAKYGEETVAAFRNQGFRAALCLCDVTRRDDMHRLTETAVKEFGGIDILVHCAADIPLGTIADLADDDFDTCIRSVLNASFWLTKDATPHLAKAKDGGRVIFISSTCGIRTVLPALAHYAAAKAGLDAFARAAATELGPLGITVNTVNPGLIASDRMQSMVSQEHQNAMTAGYPIARVGTTEDIADLVTFLASSKASYITGENIVIDGGATLSTSDVTSRMN